MNEIMNTEETANYLKISMPTLYKMIQRNEIPYVRLGSRILFRKNTIDAFLKSKEVNV